VIVSYVTVYYDCLYENDVKLGSTVAIKREPIDPLNKGPGGYNTPFYSPMARSR
jgi:hypothetical protein